MLVRYAAERSGVMRRRLFDVLATMSLLLCVAVCILWVRSSFQRDHVYRLQPSVKQDGPGWDSLGATSGGGRLTLYRQVAALRLFETRTVQAKNGKWGLHWISHPSADDASPGSLISRLGFRYEHWGRGMQFERHWYIGAPHWSVAAILVAFPMAQAAAAVRRRRRIAQGLCVACGYDLRATHGRCPECGAQPQVPPSAAA